MKLTKMILATLLAACLCATCCNPNQPVEPEGPAVPEGLTLKKATETSLTIQWGLVDGATGYDWQLLAATGASKVQGGSTSARNVEIVDLTPGTDYNFQVRSSDGTRTSDWSASLSVSTVKGEDPVDPPGPGPDPNLSANYEEFLIPAIEEDGKARAFPGAEGGGMWATGGRGGKVLHVTSLADSNTEGTLRWAVSQNYPRIIVFDVAGVIELNGTLNINRDNVTIAGQTAPGDGICLKNYRVAINASNVIIRFIRCRMGDEKKTEDDAMNIMDHDGGKLKNIIIDHCSLSWCTDECASFYGMSDFSFQWNIVSESLRVSVHGKGNHGYGGIWGGENATYHHNLLAHHDSRNPRIDHDYVCSQKGPVSLVNNVIYNWGSNTCYGGESANNEGVFRMYNVLNNYYKPGPATNSKKIWFIDPTTSCSNCSGSAPGAKIVPGHFYMTGNYMDGNSGMTSDNWTGTTAGSGVIAQIKADAPFTYPSNPSSLSLHSAQDAFTAVLAYAGASYAQDSIDKRVTGEAREGKYTYTGSKGGTKGIIDTQTDVKDDTWKDNWPQYKGEASNDSDADGMPDWFEDQFGLGKNNPADAAAGGLDKNGRYTNLEMYLHYLVRNIVAGGNANGTYTNL